MRTVAKVVLVFLFISGILAVLLNRGGRTRAEVLKVVDGDTLRVLLNGKREYVRLVGIDAPELKRGGEKARNFLAQLCPVGSTIYLEIFGRDRYGRLLAEVYTENGLDVNHALLKENLAVPLVSLDP